LMNTLMEWLFFFNIVSTPSERIFA